MSQNESSSERFANSFRDLNIGQTQGPIVVEAQRINANAPRLSNEEVATLASNHADQAIYLRTLEVDIPVKIGDLTFSTSTGQWRVEVEIIISRRYLLDAKQKMNTTARAMFANVAIPTTYEEAMASPQKEH